MSFKYTYIFFYVFTLFLNNLLNRVSKTIPLLYNYKIVKKRIKNIKRELINILVLNYYSHKEMPKNLLILIDLLFDSSSIRCELNPISDYIFEIEYLEDIQYVLESYLLKGELEIYVDIVEYARLYSVIYELLNAEILAGNNDILNGWEEVNFEDIPF